MPEENKKVEKKSSTPSGPNKEVKTPETVFVMDSWDGVDRQNRGEEKNKK